MAETPAHQLALMLEKMNLRLVLAESCTGGKAASLLTEVPGISRWFCGSAVTYRERTKQQWLGVPEDVLAEFTAESQATSDAMARGVLTQTNEANLACSITGHLGPGANSAIDGLVYVSLAVRAPKDAGSSNLQFNRREPVIDLRRSFRLVSQSRIERQFEAAKWMLQQVVNRLLDVEQSGTW